MDSYADNITTNTPEFSVSDISGAVKRTVEGAFSHIRVRGELGRVTIAQSGHMYATLKDQNATLDAVCWRGSMGKLSIKPEEGLEVICTGRLSTYSAGRSSYQLIVSQMEAAGEGAILKLLEERKKKLTAEGLFDPQRKKDLPFIPQRIGVITSPSGAVIRDIIHRITDRFPMPILLWPVPVQGMAAANAVTQAIHGMNALPDDQKPDILIIARGGGSLEDLMPFQEEEVVRAVAASHIPVISAIGHETDTTLIDYAADLRAPTPTGAAEMAVPVRDQLIAQVMDDATRLNKAIMRLKDDKKTRLDATSRNLANPHRLTESKSQALDLAIAKLTPSLSAILMQKTNQLQRSHARLKTPQDRLTLAQQSLGNMSQRMMRAAAHIGQDEVRRLNATNAMLESLSFKNVLKRGYALVKGADGAIITYAQNLTTGDKIDLIMQDSDALKATITD